MKIQGHEIPEELVREVEDVILGSTLPTFEEINVACAVRFGEGGRSFKARIGAGDLGWAHLAGLIAKRILQRLKKSGRIEYLGRSQGWRVKR